MTNDTRIHHRACNLCEAICGLEITVEGRDIVSIRGDKKDPLSRGHVCPKAVALKDLYEDPDRLRRPVKRVGDGWQEIEWDEAIELVADGLAKVVKAHGNDGVGAYLGNPTVHNYGSITHAQRFLGKIRTKNRFSATSVDQLPHHLVAYLMYGHQFLLPIPDIDRTDYFLVLGGNPMASNGSLMTVPDFPKRLLALKERGGKLVVLDPRRTETADVASEHVFVKPGGDVAFLLALVRILFDEGLVTLGRLAACVDGLDELERHVRAFDVSHLALYAGVDERTIRRIAGELTAAKAAAVYGRTGVSMQRWGTLCQWLIQALNVMTGNLDREGGVLVTHPAFELVGSMATRPGHFNKWKSRVRGLPEFGGELPVAVLSEEITTPGEGQIRAMVTLAGNPVLSTPNGASLDRALASLDFMVSIDLYVNETTRHAHVILPPTMTLEHDHYDIIFQAFAVRNTARYSEPLFEKPEGALHDYEIFERLGERLAEKLGAPPVETGNEYPAPHVLLDLALKMGPYGKGPLADGLEALRREPHGVDLGPLKPSFPDRLQHPDRRIRLAPTELIGELAVFSKALDAPSDDNSLRLIGRRHVRNNNSWMHNSFRLVKGPARDRLLMHPEDLAARGLENGQRVALGSRAGSVVVEVEASTDMMRGVVSLPHGFGHGRKGVRLRVAEAHAGVSANDVTDETWLDSLSGNAALNGVAVTVEAVRDAS
jgi:anaerobic selenocysteine-containing dehydrogenase